MAPWQRSDRCGTRPCFLAICLLAGSIGVCTLIIPPPVRAEIFFYVDPQGVYHFTNVPTDSRFQRLDPPDSATQPPVYRNPEILHRINRLIDETAVALRLDAHLLRAVVKVESDFDPLAVSVAGAMGLMQLMPATARRWAVQDPFNPGENLWGGARHLRHLLDLFQGSLPLALAAYHAGERFVIEHAGIPPIPATQRYVRKVLGEYQKYRAGR